jgi:hypothetical protein
MGVHHSLYAHNLYHSIDGPLSRTRAHTHTHITTLTHTHTNSPFLSFTHSHILLTVIMEIMFENDKVEWLVKEEESCRTT